MACITSYFYDNLFQNWRSNAIHGTLGLQSSHSVNITIQSYESGLVLMISGKIRVVKVVQTITKSVWAR